MAQEHKQGRKVQGIDTIGLWLGLTIFCAGLAIFVPLGSWIFAIKVISIPFCVLLTQIVDRVGPDALRRVWPGLHDQSVDLIRTGLLLLPFVVLFSVFALRDGMDAAAAVQAFSARFFLCLMVVPGSLLTVRAVLRLCAPRKKRPTGQDDGGRSSRNSFSRIARG